MYECDGEVEVDVVASPKFHKYVVAPIVVFVKAKLFPLKHWLLLLIVNDGTDFGLTFTIFVVESLHPRAVDETSFTVNAPALVYACEGDVDVDVVASPKFHK